MASVESRQRQTDRRLAVTLALLALAASLLMVWFVTERVPHIEDEIAYLFQARVFARGELWAPPAPAPQVFFTPFVLTINGRRIGKYPIGWPLLLAAGEVFRVGWLVNPVLNSLTTLLIFLTARVLFGRPVAVTAALLAIFSPFALIQSSLYLSHTAAAFWVAVMLWALLRARVREHMGRTPVVWYALLGASFGMLFLTRPFTAAAVAVPFAGALAAHAWKHPAGQAARFASYWPVLIAAGAVMVLQPVYLYAVTGDPFTNLYTLVWPYDRIGFGEAFGRSGHTLQRGLHTAYQDLVYGWASDLYGWQHLSWLPVLGGLVLALTDSHRRNRFWPLLFVGIFVSLVVFHLAYWIGGTNLGPRYYYEAHAGLAILGGYGLHSIIAVLRADVEKIPRLFEPHDDEESHTPVRPPGTTLVVLVTAALIIVNLTGYLPTRIADWHGHYEITRRPIDELRQMPKAQPIIVLVSGGRWRDYGALFSLNSPWYDGEIVVAHHREEADWQVLMEVFPEREIWLFTGQGFTPLVMPASSTN